MSKRPFIEYTPWLLCMGGLLLTIGGLLFGLGGSPSWAATDERRCSPPPAMVELDAGLVADGPHVLVNGIASIDVVPDVVDLSVVLSVEMSSPRKAVARLRPQQDQLIAALAEEGITGADLRTSQVSVSPVWDDYPHNRIRAYAGSVTLIATLHDLDKIGDVLERAAGFELSSLTTHFRSTQMSAKKKQLRTLALEAARDKARQSAQVLDATLGPVLAIEELSRNDRGGWGSLANVAVNEFVQAEIPEQGLVPGAVTLTLSVEVEYALTG